MQLSFWPEVGQMLTPAFFRLLFNMWYVGPGIYGILANGLYSSSSARLIPLNGRTSKRFFGVVSCGGLRLSLLVLVG